MATCSVIILNWNGAAMLRKFLPTVLKYTNDPDYEVIVADNGSTDDSIDVVQQINTDALTQGISQTARVFPFAVNHGFAEGYNRAIAQVESLYTVLLNSDVEVTEGWLQPMLDYMDTHGAVAAVQPKIRSWRKKNCFEHAGAAGGYLSRMCYPYCRGRVLWHVEEDKGQYDTTVNVDWTSGACMCVRTEVYKECGGLDAAFFAHMEEIDLCWRMRNKGWRLVCLPESVVYHLGGGSLHYDSPRKTYLNHRNNLLMIYKNKQHPFVVLLIRCLLDYAAALFYLLQGRFGACKAVFAARYDYHKMRRNYPRG